MKKLLIIDDDPLITTVYRKHFVDDGFEVMTANGGREGLEAVHDFRPDAVLLDLNMPEVSGVEMLEELRADIRFAKLKVVVFTAGTVGWQVWAANNSDASIIFKEGANPKDVVKAINAVVRVTH